jgi:uncharacterized protein
MKAPHFDPARLDVAAFARAGATLRGQSTLERFTRLAQSTVTPADGAPGAAEWVLDGLGTERAGRAPEVRLHLVARCTVWLECQRCLQPMPQALAVDGLFRFVPSEDEAARLDEESEEDVLALPRALKLDELIEDELILALPIVPVHGVCPVPIAFSGEPVATDLSEILPDASAPVHPFAALAALKPPKRPG